MRLSILKKPIGLLSALAVAFAAVSPAAFAESLVLAETSAVVAEDGVSYGTMRGLTALQIVNDMGAGWNLGNSLEASGGETNWGNPKTTKEMIDKIAAAGFKTLRIPVRWDEQYSNSSTYEINSSFLDRVEEVVNYGLDNGMYVILNIHHNALQSKVSTDNATQTQVCAELTSLWTQIATRFKPYGDKLIFETNNEPRCDEDWGGNAEYYDCVNLYNETARVAIRKTGGNNEKRLITMPTYCASADDAKISAWEKAADDDMIAVSLHAYLPYDFAFDGSGHSTWQTSDDAELDALFSRIDRCFLSKGIPVIMDEFGAVNKSNTSEREAYAQYYIAAARQFAEQDIPCVWWDNNAFGVGAENFGIFNRSGLSFTYPNIAQNLVDGYEGNPAAETACLANITYFSGSESTNGQYGSINIPTNAVTELEEGQFICAKYSSDKTPQLILQSWTAPSSQWVQVPPTECSNGVAKWSYSAIKNSAYPYADYAYLDAVLIGDTGAVLTLTEVYVPNENAHTHVYNGTAKVTIPATETTCGRQSVSCSVSGCTAEKVVVLPVVEKNTIAAPTNVKVTAADGKAAVTWDAVSGATKYKVFTYLNGSIIGSTDTTSNSVTIGNLTNGTTYGFLVRAGNDDGWSDYTEADIVYATPASTKPVPTATAGDERVTLTWDAITGASKYLVFSYLNGTYKTVNSNCTTTSCTVTGLTNGTTYGFLVRAYVNGAWSTYSTADVVYATPVSTRPVPTATAGDGRVTLTWNPITGASKYLVFSYLNGTYKTVVSNCTTTSCTVTGLTNGTTYGFLVRAYVNGAWSTYSTADVVYATPVSTRPVPTATAGDGRVTLTWNAVPNATAYRVFTYLNGSYTIYSANYTGTSIDVTGLSNGTKYGFLVRAYANGAWSSYSTADVVYATPVSTRPVPTATAGDGRVTLTWNAVPNATAYRVFTYLNGSYTIYSANYTGTSIDVTGLINGTKYGFLVRAYANGEWSSYSIADVVYATPTA